MASGVSRFARVVAHVPVPRPCRGEAFLRGPLPMAWLERAASLPGRALHIGVMLWYYVGLHKSARVKFSLSRCERRLGFDRTTATRGLAALERAGLVTVERRPGQRPVVTVIHNPAEPVGDC
jgi:hypothetical protein